ncbi:ImuA family protein [Marimonas lutisalis]|uniref:ImuA family protein n=1 Tax=Marimonas lutisalis TaxID=2545756 RepID=UPI0010F43CC4|nr:hypothetical protein [Marimonas lutisalis]
MSIHAHPLLPQRQNRDRPAIRLAPDLSLAQARLHEACGAARRSFALWVAGQMQGPVFWIALRWEKSALNPDGMAPIADPARFIFVAPERPVDLLWSMEECLRAGAVPLVVADLPEPPPLTPVRRLHLAAETGAREGAHRPLGLILTPGQGGAPGVETRWRMQPAHHPGGQRWRLSRLRARTEPVREWDIGWQDGGFHPGPALQAADA